MKITAAQIYRDVYAAIKKITYHVDPAVIKELNKTRNAEQSEIAKDVLDAILLNHELSPKNSIPMCQDTGTTVVFAELGIDVQLEEPLQDTINRALSAAQSELPLRASIAFDPFFSRENSGNNCPAILHIKLVWGNTLRLMIAQKGGGAENMSFMKMFNPGISSAEIVDFVVNGVLAAGSKPCPPLILGIGIGGNFEQAPLLAKRALFEPLGRAHPDEEYHKLEQGILAEINAKGCGAQGFGGACTALAVHILHAPCHIASLPIAVNLQCHAHRHIVIEVSRETN
jgi:fumarate hydratase subunit alpha